MPQSKPQKEPFLDSYNLLSKFSRLLAINNLEFPAYRSRNIKLDISTSDKIKTGIKVILLTCALITHTTVYTSVQATTEPLAITTMSLFATCIFFTNLFIEFRFRSRLWAFISGICDFDHAVCNSFANRWKSIYINFMIDISFYSSNQSFVKIKKLGAKSIYNYKIIVKSTLIFIIASLVNMFRQESNWRFHHKLNMTAITYLITNVWVHGIIMTSMTTYLTYSFYIYTQYSTINEHFR